jgi:hypothetical protein
LQDVGAQSGPDRGAYALVSLIGILLRADPIAVGVLIAAVVVAAVAAVIAVCSRCRRANRRAVDTCADRRARYRATGYRTISIAASGNPISPTGNAVTTSTNRPAPEMGGATASVKASTSDAATAPTSERVVGDEAGTEENGSG